MNSIPSSLHTWLTEIIANIKRQFNKSSLKINTSMLLDVKLTPMKILRGQFDNDAKLKTRGFGKIYVYSVFLV